MLNPVEIEDCSITHDETDSDVKIKKSPSYFVYTRHIFMELASQLDGEKAPRCALGIDPGLRGLAFCVVLENRTEIDSDEGKHIFPAGMIVMFGVYDLVCEADSTNLDALITTMCRWMVGTIEPLLSKLYINDVGIESQNQKYSKMTGLEASIRTYFYTTAQIFQQYALSSNVTVNRLFSTAAAICAVKPQAVKKKFGLKCSGSHYENKTEVIAKFREYSKMEYDFAMAYNNRKKVSDIADAYLLALYVSDPERPGSGTCSTSSSSAPPEDEPPISRKRKRQT